MSKYKKSTLNWSPSCPKNGDHLSACGAEVPEDAFECPDCGLPLADPAE